MLKFFKRLFSSSQKELTRSEFYSLGSNETPFLTPQGAMCLSAVQAAVKAISNETASLSIHTYERKRGGGRRVAFYHPSYRLVHDRPSELYPSDVIQRVMGVDLSLHGNFYALIIRDGTQPVAFYRLNPEAVSVHVTGQDFVYRVRFKKGIEEYSQYDILHIKGMSLDGGLTGISPIEYAQKSINLARATEKIGERYFSKGLIGPYKIKYPAGVIIPQDKKAVLKEDIEKAYAGVDNAFASIMLENGGDIEGMQVDFQQLQWLESRKLSFQEITAGIFGVPGPFVGLTENMSQYGSIQSMCDLFYRNSIRSIAISIENEFTAKLLREDEQGRFYIECNVDSLLRGNPAVQTDIWAKEIAAGILTVNEVRQMKNLPPLPETETDLPITNSVSPKVNKKALIEDCKKRVFTKEFNALKRAYKKFFSEKEDIEGFTEWAENFYESQLSTIEGTFTPVLKAITDEDKANEKLLKYQEEFAGKRFDVALKAMECDEPAKAVEHVISELEKMLGQEDK